MTVDALPLQRIQHTLDDALVGAARASGRRRSRRRAYSPSNRCSISPRASPFWGSFSDFGFPFVTASVSEASFGWWGDLFRAAAFIIDLVARRPADLRFFGALCLDAADAALFALGAVGQLRLAAGFFGAGHSGRLRRRFLARSGHLFDGVQLVVLVAVGALVFFFLVVIIVVASSGSRRRPSSSSSGASSQSSSSVSDMAAVGARRVWLLAATGAARSATGCAHRERSWRRGTATR